MKNLAYVLIFFLGLTSCLKDEDLIKPEVPEEGFSPVVMNEVMSTGDPDWIEFYNSSDEDVDMTGFTVSDSGADYVFESGTSISAKGYLVVLCDKTNTVDADGTIHTNFKISSGGETLMLKDAASKLIDEVDVPAMDEGLTWGRLVDAGDEWGNMNPTPGAPNSNENNPPIIIAEDLTEFDDVYSVTASDADGIASVKLIMYTNSKVHTLDMALLDGEYKVSPVKFEVGTMVSYYVVATDVTGKTSYFPETAPDENNSYYVTGGIPLFVDVTIDGVVPGYTEDLVFNIDVVDFYGVDEVKLYYILPGQTEADKESIAVKDVNADGIYQITIPKADIAGQQIRYYIRAESVKGEKSYYPVGVDKDDETTWPVVYEPAVTVTVNPTEGPLTKFTFPENPVPGTSIPIEMEYSSTEDILEARVYFDVGDAPVYVKANKIKGEDEDGFTQTGVTVDLQGVVADNGLAADAAGNKVSFYIRIATATAEYYYGLDGTMYLDDGTTDESDDIKDFPALWNVYNVQ